MQETWKSVKGFETRYLVSTDGKVYSTKTKKFLKPLQNEKDYLHVELWLNYKRKTAKIHRLVAETFLENPCGLKEINHKDGNKQNNHVSNLEWCTRSENMKHAYKTGLRPSRKGVKLGKRNLESGQVVKLSEKGVQKNEIHGQ